MSKAWCAKAAAKRFDLALTLGSAGGVPTSVIQACMEAHLARAYLAGTAATSKAWKAAMDDPWAPSVSEWEAAERARLLTPAKPKRTRVAKATPGVPRCRGEAYHVLALGADKCSLCGWNRYAKPTKPAKPNRGGSRRG